MRKEYEDVVARIEGANQYARKALLNNINQTIDPYSKSTLRRLNPNAASI